jgi:Tfp pilus assembly protein PilX
MDNNSAIIQLRAEFAAFKELHAEQLKARDAALVTQAAEYERRLDILNHAHEANQARNAEFVAQSRFDDYTKSAELALQTALERSDEKQTSYAEARDKEISELNMRISSKLDTTTYTEQHGALTKVVESLVSWRTGITARAGLLSGGMLILGGGLGAVIAHFLH